VRYLPVEDVGHNTGGDGQGEDHKNTQHILEHETTFQVQLTWQLRNVLTMRAVPGKKVLWGWNGT